MKIGNEVEGKFIGLRTLFLDYIEFSGMEIDDFLKLDTEYGIQQIYISDHGNILDLSNNILRSLSYDFIITVERTDFTDAPDYVNIMLVVDNESFWKLRPNDQVKFSKDLNVYSTTKRNMTITKPEDFNGDITL